MLHKAMDQHLGLIKISGVITAMAAMAGKSPITGFVGFPRLPWWRLAGAVLSTRGISIPGDHHVYTRNKKQILETASQKSNEVQFNLGPMSIFTETI